MAIITTDTVKVRTVCYTTSQISVNVMHMRCTAHAGTGGTESALALAVDNLLHAAYKNWMSSQASWRGVGVKVILPVPQNEQTSTANDGAGTGSGTMTPTQVTGVIGLYTALATKKGRGRIYPGFVDEVFTNADGSMTAGAIPVLAAIAALFAAPITVGGGGNTSTLVWGVFSKTLPGMTFPLTAAVARKRFATQRRRGQYGRMNTLPF